MHFNNYISKRAGKKILDKGLRFITITPTAKKQTPEETLEMLKKKGIEISLKEGRGRPRKLNRENVKRILAMRKAGPLSFKRIAATTGIPKSTAFDYFNRFKADRMDEGDIDGIQIKEAHRILRFIRDKNIGGEIGDLADRGLVTSDPEELQYILKEIDEVMNFYST